MNQADHNNEIVAVRLLLIDHDQNAASELTEVLKKHPFSISSAQQSETGLHKAKIENPDIILLNEVMPDVSFTEMCSHLNACEETCNIPVLLIKSANVCSTTFTIPNDTSKGDISRPFCEAQIIAQIESRLLLQSLQAELDQHHLNTTIKKQSEHTDQTHHNNEFYKTLVEYSPDAILVEFNNQCIYANPAASLLYKASSCNELLGKPLLNLVAEKDQPVALSALEELQQPGQMNNREEQALLINNQTCRVNVTRIRLDHNGQQINQIIVRELKPKKNIIKRPHDINASYDAVTHLPNRNLFINILDQAIAQATMDKTYMLVCAIELDRFKRLNDDLGYDAGDQILVHVTERISSSIRTTDTLARVDGDEFVLLLTDSGSEQFNTKIIERIALRISTPISINEKRLSLSSSIGYVRFPEDGNTGVGLLKRAKVACNHAKEISHNSIQHYNASLQLIADERYYLEQALHQAIANNELSLLYQVQIELRRGTITGIEALLRWQHPTRGLISPSVFIPIAEQAGLIEVLTQWLIRTACKQNRQWQLQGCQVVPVAVNISAESLRNPLQLESVLHQSLQESELPPELIELEFSESASMDDTESVIPLMMRLKALGLGLAIDDFGTGHSNLHYLKQLPIDKLKLDGSFVKNITTESQSLAIADAIITMAHRLNLKVIAEMAETEDQVTVLFERGCDQVQGYYFSQPLEAEECRELLDGRSMSLPYPPRQIDNTMVPVLQ